jgi:ABC-2 type transport system ATP-binding protein
MITCTELTKRYGDVVAVDDLTVSIEAGRVTGFLGPNGAGKSTTLRLMLGLDRPTSGRALVGGRPYAAIREPLLVVGAHLDQRALHPGRSARRHLLALARVNGIGARRVDEVLGLVGLEPVARRRAGGFSLGMAQRLGIAAALLGDPAVLVLDEPVNGLDADGVRWVRGLLRGLAAEGRTVLLSSHLLAELHLVADQVVVLGRGRLLADCPVGDLLTAGGAEVVLRTPDVAALPAFRSAAERLGMTVIPRSAGELGIRGGTAAAVGELAHERGLRLHGLAETTGTLEDGYRRLVGDAVEFGVAAAGAGGR